MCDRRCRLWVSVCNGMLAGLVAGLVITLLATGTVQSPW